ncbi:MAG: M56 family metallopeptidase, partial [Lewinella sp.]
ARTTWAYHRMLGLRRGSLLPDPEWRDTYLALRRKLAPDCGAEWRWSATVNEVLTVGVWRPFILFPIGLVNDLSSDEVQAILRHELAHLRRRDHLWQALQQCVVTLFFYHPLVHWLCRRLDREREFACDDLAARQIGPGIYARALLRVANYSLHPKIPFTVPATDQSSFTHRVHRLFESETSTNRRGGYLLAPLLSLPLFVLLAVGSMSVPTEVGPDAIIMGTVVDAATGDPLIGTTILVKGTVAGTITDIEGNFRLDWNGEGEITVVFTYVGYVTKEIIFDNVKDRELDIQLSKQASYEKGSLRREEGIVLSDLPTNIIVVLDGRIIEGKYLHITASEIAAVKVIKDKAEMAELGYDTEMEGVMLITSKKE